MAEVKLSREEELVAFFVHQCGEGDLGRTRLMKLLYLADYEARRYLGRPISKSKYIWHFYGPYEPGLTRWVNRLRDNQVVIEQPVVYPNGKRGFLYSRGPAQAKPTFTPAETAILAYVCRKYMQVPLRELLDDVVYQTEPMIHAQKTRARGRPLQMSRVNKAKAGELTISLEQLIERRAQVEAGEVLTHAEAMARLKGQQQPANAAA